MTKPRKFKNQTNNKQTKCRKQLASNMSTKNAPIHLVEKWVQLHITWHVIKPMLMQKIKIK